eukprot:TRINITY_DN109313_c1_g1_i1.p1 TRINITY_DN109313_c1_g1~~TRINITY_DN109313_c1_g1_i1.p1  ORF type:complete len:300 (-),score=46.46 TRINITY_DN109313_c1_g1_i1:187-1086(-)
MQRLELKIESEFIRKRVPAFLSEAQYKMEFAHTILHNRALFVPAPSSSSTKDSSKETKLRGINEGSEQVQQYLEKIREQQQVKSAPIPPQKAQHAPAQSKSTGKPALKVPEQKVKKREQLCSLYGGADNEKKAIKKPQTGFIKEEVKEYKRSPVKTKSTEIKAKVNELLRYLLEKHEAEQKQNQKLNDEMKHMMYLMHNMLLEDRDVSTPFHVVSPGEEQKEDREDLTEISKSPKPLHDAVPAMNAKVEFKYDGTKPAFENIEVKLMCLNTCLVYNRLFGANLWNPCLEGYLLQDKVYR